ncbi:MAG: hypothetical protein NZ750_12040 [Anaerolineae bacterium]|nr:hypothetical protein [Anaerolineae bacterium]MDW8173907.1 hypothetical protein [Anaerolineae bacterium]
MLPTNFPIPDDLLELTRLLIEVRKRPGTEARYKAYPAMLQRFRDLLANCDDPAVLRQVIALDSGYYLLAAYRQQVLEKLLAQQRSADVLRAYALQLELFGDVDEFGEANTDVDDRIEALLREADELD